jgi:hypothetical protein
MIIGVNDAVLSMNMANLVSGGKTTVAMRSLAAQTIKVYSGAQSLAFAATASAILALQLF